MIRILEIIGILGIIEIIEIVGIVGIFVHSDWSVIPGGDSDRHSFILKDKPQHIPHHIQILNQQAQINRIHITIVVLI